MPKKRICLLFMLFLGTLLIISGCSQEYTDSIPSDADSEQQNTSSGVQISIQEKSIRLGSSPYAIKASVDIKPIRVSNAEWEDDMKANYSNNNKTIYFAVYQFSKEGEADTLKEYAQNEAEDYNASEIDTDLVLNGIPAAYYRSTDIYSGEIMDGLTFILDADEEYLEVDFRSSYKGAENEMWKIMQSLHLLTSDSLQISEYQIQLPSDFYLISHDEANHTAVYENGSSSLVLYIRQEEAEDTSLSGFVLEKGGSDIETDTEINGIPAASYRTEEVSDGAYHSFLNYVLPDADSGFVTLSFRLDGIPAEELAQSILDTIETS